jgi:hypothetical protein
MLVASFLPWYEVDLILGTGKLTGWQDPGVIWSMLAVMVSSALALLVVKRAMDPGSLPGMPKPPVWGRLVAAWSLLPLVFVALKLITDSDFLAYGFYLAFVAGGLQAIGGLLVYREL